MQNLYGKTIHFVGINGTSISALLMLSAKLGANVSGSDAKDGEYMQLLKNKGFDVYVGINVEKAIKADLIVFSGAIKPNHPELCGKNLMERGKFLGYLSGFFNNTIAIAGTHGKTTTTAIIAHVLKNAKMDFCYTFGGIDVENQTNFEFFGRDLLLIEACEYRNSFLSLNPTISVITSIEYDHPDFFTKFEDLTQSFSKFANDTINTLILGKNVEKFITCNNAHVHTYAYDKNFEIFSTQNPHKYILSFNNEKLELESKLVGEFNYYNFAIAYIVCTTLGVNQQDILLSFKNFKGVKRRQEFIGFYKNMKCYSDYAHHPTQIKNLVESMKSNSKVIVVFEPHTYSRTKGLLKEFQYSLSTADMLIVLPTYAAREDFDAEGDSVTLFSNIDMDNKFLAKNYMDAQQILDNIEGDNYIVLFVGAGSIDEWARTIVR